MRTIDFDALPICVNGCWVGGFSGSAEIKTDATGDAYIDTITVTQDIAGTPDLELPRPKASDTFDAEKVILWCWIEAALRDRRADDLLDIEYDAAVSDLGYGPMQRERL